MKPRFTRKSNTQKSKYVPINYKKYIGNANNILCRSSWERAVCHWCDTSNSVIEWGSEEIVIPYISLVDGRKHKYYIDFYIKAKNDKIESQYIIDVKPFKQTLPPEAKGSKISQAKRLIEYNRNKSKWSAAIEYALNNKMKFEIWTEKTLSKMGILNG